MKCPICRKEVAWEENPFRPFCGERCKIIDLGNWASEKYRLALQNEEPEDELDTKTDQVGDP
jgi:uncharacterized protein